MNAKKELIIIGAGFHSLSLAELINEMNSHGISEYRILGFLDDDTRLHGTVAANYPVLGSIEEARNYPDAHFVNGIYSVKNLRMLELTLQRTGAGPERWPTVVHPSAKVSPSATLGVGVFIYPMSYVYPSAHIDDFVLIKPRGTIGVKSSIGKGSVIGTNSILAGNVRVGRYVYIGQGSSVRERLQIGDHSIVGMGSVVVGNVESGAVVYGNPARLH